MLHSVKYDAGEERASVEAMIGDSRVLSEVAAACGESPVMPSRWATLLASWCVSHFRRYGEAPGREVEVIFSRWAASREAAGDRDAVPLVERFLASLEEPRPCENPRHMADVTLRVMELERLKRHTEEVRRLAATGDLEAAERERAAYRRIEAGPEGLVDYFSDRNNLRKALDFSERAEPIVTYPGDIGRFFGRQFDRGCFVAFTGRAKVSKTFWLLDVAWRALRDRRRVAFFEVGDMTVSQITRRFASRSAGRPIHPDRYRYPTDLEVKDGRCHVSYRDERAVGTLTWEEVIVANQDFHDAFIRDDMGYLRLVCQPAGTVTPGRIKALCDRWHREGWPCDVVVIDYADLLKGPEHLRDQRDRINSVWTDLRALSQAHDCLVVTATQGDADSYNAETLSLRNFSNDRRKNDHVTAMYGINVTAEDRRDGVVRINCMAAREEEHDPLRPCFVAPCLAVANPCVLSALPAESFRRRRQPDKT